MILIHFYFNIYRVIKLKLARDLQLHTLFISAHIQRVLKQYNFYKINSKKNSVLVMPHLCFQETRHNNGVQCENSLCLNREPPNIII